MDVVKDMPAILGCMAVVGYEMLGYGVNNVKKNFVKTVSATQDGTLGNKVCIVTGGNAGIGFATAQALVGRGAKVVLACRDVQKANEAAEELRRIRLPDQDSDPQVEVMQVDLSSLASVRAFCKAFNDTKQPLHLLICNAGIMAPVTRLETVDGFEMQFQVNHLSHWLMAHELLSSQRQRRLQQQPQTGVPIQDLPSTRIVLCTSSTHTACCNGGPLDWNSENNYIPLKAYAYSKLANILCAKELQRRIDRHPEFGSDTAVAVHPGVVKTGLSGGFFSSHAGLLMPAPEPFRTWIQKGVTGILSPFHMSLEEAANSVLSAALGPDKVVAGQYYHGGHVGRPHKVAEDAGVAEQVWELSCKLAQVATDLSLA